MVKFYLTNKAVNDLSEIWNYTFHKWSEEQADKYYEMFIHSFKRIATSLKLVKTMKELHQLYLDYTLTNMWFFIE